MITVGGGGGGVCAGWAMHLSYGNFRVVRPWHPVTVSVYVALPSAATVLHRPAHPPHSTQKRRTISTLREFILFLLISILSLSIVDPPTRRHGVKRPNIPRDMNCEPPRPNSRQYNNRPINISVNKIRYYDESRR